MYAQKSASSAADAEAKAQENLLERRAEDQRNATRENARRMLLDRQRTLSELRVRQAAQGFSQSGTQLAVLGEFGSRLDEQIDEATTRGLGVVQQYRENIRMARWSTGVRHTAEGINLLSTGIQGATKLGSSLYSDYRQNGVNPFNIF